MKANNSRKQVPFRVGDSVKVHTRVREGDKERTQVFAGVVIAHKGRGLNESFTVRRISYGEGIERVFPLNSPRIEKIEVEREGQVRRAKLFYLRGPQGQGSAFRQGTREGRRGEEGTRQRPAAPRPPRKRPRLNPGPFSPGVVQRRRSLRWKFELGLRPEGCVVVAGVDEVGRGLLGPARSTRRRQSCPKVSSIGTCATRSSSRPRRARN